MNSNSHIIYKGIPMTIGLKNHCIRDPKFFEQVKLNYESREGYTPNDTTDDFYKKKLFR